MMYNWTRCLGGYNLEGYNGGVIIMMIIGVLLLGIFLYLILKGQKNDINFSRLAFDKHQFEAIEIAKLRYARGEITFEEFENIKKNLI